MVNIYLPLEKHRHSKMGKMGASKFIEGKIRKIPGALLNLRLNHNPATLKMRTDVYKPIHLTCIVIYCIMHKENLYEEVLK